MARPDPALLDPARYPFQCRIATRFGDLDPNMHLNNVALVGILEDARVRFQAVSKVAATTEGITTMIASHAVEYLGQAYYPQPLDIHSAMSHVGRTSCGMVQLVLQERRVVGLARSVIVCVADDRPVPLSRALLDDIAAWMLRP